MSCCCSNTHKICDAIVCDGEDLVLPIPVTQDGAHTLQLDFLGNVITEVADFTTGQTEMRFEKSQLNERFTYVGQVIGPDGDPVAFTIDEVEYNCIEFSTRRNLSPTPNESSS